MTDEWVVTCDVCGKDVPCDPDMSAECMGKDSDDVMDMLVVIRCWGCSRETCVVDGGDC